jgi:hypothetical protein
MQEVWFVQPQVLLKKQYLTELYPTETMSSNQKINAVSRTILLLSLLGAVLCRRVQFVVIGVVTLAILYSWYRLNGSKKAKTKEAFSTNPPVATDVLNTPAKLKSALKKTFHGPTPNNPFGNLLLTEITDDPERKAAEPAFNPYAEEASRNNMKAQVQEQTPGIDTDKELFGDLYDNFTLDNSMQRFYTTANTRVANDQGAFAQFLYGDMPSGKENNAGGALARVQDSYRYTTPPVHKAI